MLGTADLIVLNSASARYLLDKFGVNTKIGKGFYDLYTSDTIVDEAVRQIEASGIQYSNIGCRYLFDYIEENFEISEDAREAVRVFKEYDDGARAAEEKGRRAARRACREPDFFSGKNEHYKNGFLDTARPKINFEDTWLYRAIDSLGELIFGPVEANDD